MATKPNLKISVISDLACPWCYVGKSKLDKALASMPEVKADIEWHAFLLDWGARASGLPIQEALAKKFGAGQGEAIMQRIVSAGRPDGANFANWKWRANTVKGHMLVALARRHGKSHEANALLFQKSYETGDNISETSVILDVGRQLGLPEEELQSSFCDGGLDEQLLKEVQQSDTFAKSELRVSGVPYFRISCDGGKTIAVAGAQPVEAFKEVIRRVLRESAAADASGGAPADGGESTGAGCT